MKIVLDSGPVGLLTTTSVTPDTLACEEWLDQHAAQNSLIYLSEVIVYEIRRELLRINSRKGLARLQDLKIKTHFLEMTTPAWNKAAEFWAETRKRGKPTASEKALDIDVILAAQAWDLAELGEPVVIATMNQKHLRAFVPAEHWKDIRP